MKINRFSGLFVRTLSVTAVQNLILFIVAKRQNCKMEPMALGSPSHDSPQKPIYLPGYLMGERAQSPIGNVSISTMSPLRANRSHTSDVHTTFLMRNFHHELSDKPYALYNNWSKRILYYSVLFCFSDLPLLSLIESMMNHQKLQQLIYLIRQILLTIEKSSKYNI